MEGKAERQAIGERRQSASGRPEFDDRRMRGAESSIAHHPPKADVPNEVRGRVPKRMRMFIERLLI